MMGDQEFFEENWDRAFRLRRPIGWEPCPSDWMLVRCDGESKSVTGRYQADDGEVIDLRLDDDAGDGLLFALWKIETLLDEGELRSVHIRQAMQQALAADFPFVGRHWVV